MRESAGETRPTWLWAACFLPFLLLVVARWRLDAALTEGDYAQYYLHATALLQGRPYGDIGYIYTQYNQWLGPPTQPPGLPLTLLPIFAVFGPNAVAIKLLIVISGLLLLCLAGLRIARSEGRLAGAAVVMIVGVALESMSATSSAISDLGFSALTWGLFLAADRPGAWSVKRIALVTLLGLGAMSYRTAGAALIPAMLLFAVMRREGWRPLVPVLIWVLMGALVVLELRVGTTVMSALPTSMAGILFSLKASVNVYAVRGSFEAILYPFPWRQANIVYHVVAFPVLAWGLARLLWRERRTLMVAFFVAYMAMLFVVPVREDRYLWPVLPIYALGFFEGLRALLALRSHRDARDGDRVAFASSAALAIAAMCVVLMRPPRETLFQHPEVRALFTRIAALPRSPAPRVVFANPHVLTWYTGVTAMPTLDATTNEAMAELRRARITHVVVGDLGIAPKLDSVLRRAVADSAQAFVPVYRDSLFTLLALRPADTSAVRREQADSRLPARAAPYGAAR
jgi:hypothetical protein